MAERHTGMSGRSSGGGPTIGPRPGGPPIGPRPGGHGPGGMRMGPKEKVKDFSGTLKRLMGFLKPQLPALSGAVLMTVVNTVLATAAPVLLGMITTAIADGINSAVGIIDFNYILKIVAMLAGLFLISSLFGYVQQFIVVKASQKIVSDMRQKVNQKISRLPLKHFDQNSIGDILSRVTNDVDNISNTLQQNIIQIISAVVTMASILIFMLLISPVLTLVSLMALPLAFLITSQITKRSQRFFVSQSSYTGKLNGHTEEMYTGHKIITAFGHEQKAIEEFNDINQKLYDVSWKAQFVSFTIMPLMGFVNNLSFVVMSIVGGIFVMRGFIKIGQLQALLVYSRQFSQPINQIANIMNMIQSAVASAERIFELLDAPEQSPDNRLAIKPAEPKGDVKFQHVKFGYVPENILIHDMNIDVKPGQTIAIVGPTGAGKTTIVNLLMRFYDLNGGKILVDGVDITEMKRGDLRKIFGMVLQDTWLFEGTVKENIRYGCDQATDGDIINAAKAVHIHQFIKTLPHGYDTVLTEDASNISQGQKQLLTIARTLISNPPVLILDEATSSVDTRTEVLIQKAMSMLMKGRTSFVIAHRLSTIRNADIILVMNKGSIIQQGSHHQLMADGGFYANLYNSQFEN